MSEPHVGRPTRELQTDRQTDKILVDLPMGIIIIVHNSLSNNVHAGLTMLCILIIKWLETDFLGYLDEWEISVQGRKGFTAAERKKMRLSDETLEGLRITGNFSR